jgi:hypothetical protein
LDRVVPFSCKGRGFCPSCGGRHMADTAAHLVDRVLSRVPLRQWVLSLPFGLRYRLAFDRELTADVLRVFVRAVFGSLRRRTRPAHRGRSLACAVARRLRAGPNRDGSARRPASVALRGSRGLCARCLSTSKTLRMLRPL